MLSLSSASSPLPVCVPTRVFCVISHNPFYPIVCWNLAPRFNESYSVSGWAVLYQAHKMFHVTLTVSQDLLLFASLCNKEWTSWSSWITSTAGSYTLSLGSSAGRQKTRTTLVVARCNVADVTSRMLHVLWNWIRNEAKQIVMCLT